MIFRFLIKLINKTDIYKPIISKFQKSDFPLQIIF